MQSDYFPSRRINLDITHRCPLECLRCGRQTHWKNKGNSVPGHDLKISDFIKIADYAEKISFCGQYSDPIHHPQFIQMLEICHTKNVNTVVHVASSFKSEKWFVKAFKSNPDAQWIFGIDGLPQDRPMYRINQDSMKLFNIMLKSKKYLKSKPTWQYILFKFNEHSVSEAQSLAELNNLLFRIINSSRWMSESDPLIPTSQRKNNFV